MNQPTYTLTLSENQARTTAAALEFYTRFCIGQFEVPDVVKWRKKPDGQSDTYDRDRFDTLMLEIRAMFFPELRGIGHSYGVGWNEKREQQEAQIGYEVYKWILYEFNKDSKHYNVHSSPPCLHYSGEPIPKFVRHEAAPE